MSDIVLYIPKALTGSYRLEVEAEDHNGYRIIMQTPFVKNMHDPNKRQVTKFVFIPWNRFKDKR